jgi:hypothetical protein
VRGLVILAALDSKLETRLEQNMDAVYFTTRTRCRLGFVRVTNRFTPMLVGHKMALVAVYSQTGRILYFMGLPGGAGRVSYRGEHCGESVGKKYSWWMCVTCCWSWDRLTLSLHKTFQQRDNPRALLGCVKILSPFCHYQNEQGG